MLMMQIKKITHCLMASLLMLGLFLQALEAAEPVGAENKIEKVDFVAQSGGRVAIKIKTTLALPNVPPSFTLNNPPRLAFDFLAIGNGLVRNNLSIDQGVLKTIQFAEAKDRTRMVINLTKSVGYNTSIQGNELTILLQAGDLASDDSTRVSRFAEPKAGDQKHELKNLDFMRGKNGEGHIVMTLSDANTGIDLKQKGKTVMIDFINASVAENLQRRLNVINFNTPVLYVDTMKVGTNTRIIIEPKGNWEQSAYQADKKFIVDIRPVLNDPNKLVQGSKAGYAGEKLSLNFQNVDVRTVLQVIADFTGLNIITSDTVTGNITLRLKDVPWDQALDIVMQSKGLTQRKNGNVVVVAPAEEVANKEKATLEAKKTIDDLEPLRTEVFTLRYQKAEAFKNILTGSNENGGTKNNSILTSRGSAVWDPRTNTIFVQDTVKKLEEIQHIINKTDVPVKQVLIESRLVVADEKFGKSLGAKFGVTASARAGGNALTTSGTLGNRYTSVDTSGVPTQGNHNGAIQTNTDSAYGGTNRTLTSSDGNPDLMSNLAVANPAGSLALSLLTFGKSTLLNLELSALETDKRGKVISSPRVITANQQKAVIEQGTEIPYITPASASSTTPAVAFKKAVLSLEVTPQITPDNRIIMDLYVKKDAVGQIFNNVPSIDTQNVRTQVLVGNGETAVLGGIFEQAERTDVTKVPFFGDLPFIGNAFKNTIRQNDKTELLIFVTPKVVDDSLAIR
jgi:type IV pilus assembly protein PilQ